MATDVSGLSSDAQQVFEAALRLPDAQRAKLADCLWESIAPTADPEWEKAWAAEIARRIAEIENGTARFVNWEDLRRELRETIHAARQVPNA
ncbi:MAG TPA: addiction module protein [Pirellulales bacterium]|nr:addiction module protein [Pirellulales bacterium]